VPSSNRERALWVALVAVALAIRVTALGDRPMHHDEAQYAYDAWRFFTTGHYEYQPVLHGPLPLYLQALAFVGGVGEFTARLAAALAGTAIVALCFALRPVVGRIAAFAAAALIAIDPTLLWHARFDREDTLLVLLALALVLLCVRAPARPGRLWAIGVGALLAAAAATKESAAIEVLAGAIALAVVGAAHPAVRRRSLELARGAWVLALVGFAVVFTVLFTTFLTHPGGLIDALYEGPKYWLRQHEVGRGEAWYFYGLLLVTVEWPILLLGIVGAVGAVRRRDPFGLFLILYCALNLIAYSYARERFPQLLMHPLLPLCLLGGMGAAGLWAARERAAARLGLVLAGAGCVCLALISLSVNALHPSDPRELLPSTHTAPEVADASARILRMGHPTVLIDSADAGAWPWAWYLRDLPVGYADLATTPPAGQRVVISSATRARALVRRLPGYRAERLRLRNWWVRDDSRLTPASWLRWSTSREPWSPTGHADVVMFVAPRRR
jgi:uncharacterized protein (TIGR03663 family)